MIFSASETGAAAAAAVPVPTDSVPTAAVETPAATPYRSRSLRLIDIPASRFTYLNQLHILELLRGN
jgi:hypothetical protein